MEETEKSEAEAPEEKELPKEENKEKKQPPEVVARKGRGYLAALILSLVFEIFAALMGVIILAVGIAKGGDVPMYIVASVIFAGGVAMTVYGGISIKRVKRIPEVIITREGDTLNFFVTKKVSFSCKTKEITNVSYVQAYGRGQTRPWGTLTLYFGEKELRLTYIQDVVAAHNRLFALMLDAKKKEEKKSGEAEKIEEIKTEEDGESNG